MEKCYPHRPSLVQLEKATISFFNDAHWAFVVNVVDLVVEKIRDALGEPEDFVPFSLVAVDLLVQDAPLIAGN